MEEIKLIQGCKNNQSEAQKALFEQFAPSMMTVCKRYIGNLHDAEECMFNGFLKFFQKIARFEYRGTGSISAYLRQIMVNECLMHLRNTQIIMTEEIEEHNIYKEEDALDRLSAAEIMHLIMQLPTGYRVVFNLYVVEGMSHQQIAETLNIKEGTSKSQLSKARASLQEMIIKMKNHGIKS